MRRSVWTADQPALDLLDAACKKVQASLILRRQSEYDHSYYFISTFVRDHIERHAKASSLKENLRRSAMQFEDDENVDDENVDAMDFLQREFSCPYCWETVEPPLEADLEGELVWDCEVCCRPWLIRIRTEIDGTKSVVVGRAQE